MTSNDPVLILTNPKDPHSDAVIHFLYRMGVEVVRFHAGEAHLDSSISLTGQGGVLRIESSGRTLSTDKVRSCWYRRPEPVADHTQHLQQPDRHLVGQETNAVLWGLWGCINAVWYSHPYQIRRAAWKLYQLQVAASVGFRIPDYVVSNDPRGIGAFLDAHNHVVLKPIDEQTTWLEIDGQPMSMFIKKFEREELAALTERKPISPCFLQEYIEKSHDVRVTVMGRSIFAVAIKPQGRGEEVVDWREHTLEMNHEVIECPPSISDAMLAFMKHMGLNFGAFDFAVDRRTGGWYFLECNPNGQWLWIEIKTGLKMAETFAQHLSLQRPPLIQPRHGSRYD
jgi:hypothetical protein